MGIKGLFEYVGQALRQGHISEFRAKTLGVDISCLLHKSIYVAASRFSEEEKSRIFCGNEPEFVKRYHEAVLKHLHLYLDYMLRYIGKIVLVFDGKAPLNKIRKLKAEAESGPSPLATPYTLPKFRITREIVELVKTEFSKCQKIEIVQSPGESDPQLAFLSLNGVVDVLVTDDSDLIVYGCERV